MKSGRTFSGGPFRSEVYITAVILLITFILTACAIIPGKDNEPGPSSGTKTDISSSAASGSVTDVKPYTISWFVAFEWFKEKWDDNNLMCKQILNETGCRIEYQSGNEQKLNELIASDSLPDVITMDKNAPQRVILENPSKSIPMDQLLAEYAPEYKFPEKIQQLYRNKDGNLYVMVNLVRDWSRMPDGFPATVLQTLCARKDIADRLSIRLDDFNTQDGFVSAMKKVLASDIGYNGLDILPFYFTQGLSDCIFGFAQGFGIAREDSDGNFLDWRRQLQTLEALKFVNRLYREGIIRNDNLTSNSISDIISKGNVFAFAGWSGVNFASMNLELTDENVNTAAIGPVRSSGGTIPYYELSPSDGWAVTLITNRAEYPDRIARLIDFKSAVDGCIENNYGLRGICWDYDKNGNVRLFPETVKEMKQNYITWRKKNLFDLMWMYNREFEIWEKTPLESRSKFEKVQDNITRYYDRFAYDNSAMIQTIPAGYTNEAEIMSKINEYWEKQCVDIILADSSKDAEDIYQQTLKHIDQFGWKTLYDYINGAFWRNKVAQGVRFTWPGNIPDHDSVEGK